MEQLSAEDDFGIFRPDEHPSPTLERPPDLLKDDDEVVEEEKINTAISEGIDVPASHGAERREVAEDPVAKLLRERVPWMQKL